MHTLSVRLWYIGGPVRIYEYTIHTSFSLSLSLYYIYIYIFKFGHMYHMYHPDILSYTILYYILWLHNLCTVRTVDTGFSPSHVPM